MFSNRRHPQWRMGFDTILKGNHSWTIPTKFGLICFSGYREDLNVICYQE
jgi:hypothetical protein